MTRQPLANRRYNESSEFLHQGIRYDMQIGIYEDGRVGEVFVQMEKAAGTLADVNARDVAILISMAIQYGIPLDRIDKAMTKDSNGHPEGFGGAVIQHLMQWQPVKGGWRPDPPPLEPGPLDYVPDEPESVQGEGSEPLPVPKITAEHARGLGFTGDQCTSCNSMKMKVSGHCLVCEDCGTTTGCS